jgi:hypothetical protein
VNPQPYAPMVRVEVTGLCPGCGHEQHLWVDNRSQETTAAFRSQWRVTAPGRRSLDIISVWPWSDILTEGAHACPAAF